MYFHRPNGESFHTQEMPLSLSLGDKARRAGVDSISFLIIFQMPDKVRHSSLYANSMEVFFLCKTLVIWSYSTVQPTILAGGSDPDALGPTRSLNR